MSRVGHEETLSSWRPDRCLLFSVLFPTFKVSMRSVFKAAQGLSVVIVSLNVATYKKRKIFSPVFFLHVIYINGTHTFESGGIHGMTQKGWDPLLHSFTVLLFVMCRKMKHLKAALFRPSPAARPISPGPFHHQYQKILAHFAGSPSPASTSLFSFWGKINKLPLDHFLILISLPSFRFLNSG